MRAAGDDAPAPGRPGRVLAHMEDDFHRFAVELAHDGARVTAVRGEALRYPWTECPGAVEPLRALEGMRLSTRPTAPARETDPRRNCTHLFDVATLAVTHAAAARRERQYDIGIPDRDAAGTRARLWRDGTLLLDWQVEKQAIAAPPPWAGVGLRGRSFVAWVEANLDDETAEAALALRRACFISLGRMRDLDEARDATAYMPLAKGSCHSFREGIAERALRVRGTTLEFTHAPERLLADLDPPPRAGSFGTSPAPG